YAVSVNGPVTVDLANPANNAGDAAGDSYASIEGIFGTGFNDTITGNGGNNLLFGAYGDDILIGGGGADELHGGPGAGADTFVFGAAALADAQLPSPLYDIIVDFNQNNTGTYNAAEGDRLDVSALLAAAYAGGR